MKSQTDQKYALSPKALKILEHVYVALLMVHKHVLVCFLPSLASNYLTAFCSHTCAVLSSKCYRYGMQNNFLVPDCSAAALSMKTYIHT